MAEVIPPVVAAYAHSDTVTVSIYKVDGTVMIAGAACSEIGASGRFYYQPVFAAPATKTAYVVIFTNGTYEQTGELVLGGYDYQGATAVAALNNLSEAQALAQASAALGTYDAPTKAELDSAIASIPALVWAGAGGSETYTDTILDTGGDPIASVDVEAYSDSDRTTLVATAETDVNGVFIFYLNPGTFYCRAVKSGYSFTDWTKVVA